MTPETFMAITAVASLREAHSHRSERVSELLFGETCTSLEFQGDFVKVRLSLDGYEGWCQKRQLTSFDFGESTPDALQVRGLSDRVFVNGVPVALSAGSIAYTLKGSNRMHLGPYALDFQVEPDSELDFQTKRDELRHYANMFLGTPYLWGGRSRYGIDCSGLTQTVFKLAGILIPRDSGAQSKEGEIVNLIQEARVGDLAFFDNEEGAITHVGMMMGTDRIIHSSASVRIDPIDSYGIVHQEEGIRTHKLRIIKRYF